MCTKSLENSINKPESKLKAFSLEKFDVRYARDSGQTGLLSTLETVRVRSLSADIARAILSTPLGGKGMNSNIYIYISR